MFSFNLQNQMLPDCLFCKYVQYLLTYQSYSIQENLQSQFLIYCMAKSLFKGESSVNLLVTDTPIPSFWMHESFSTQANGNIPRPTG